MTLNAPTRTDELVNLQVEGVPGEFVFLMYGEQPSLPLWLPPYFGTLLQTNPGGTIFAGNIDGAGSLTYLANPFLGPSNLGASRYIQSILFDPAAPQGQRLKFGPASALIVLHPTIN